MNESLVEKWTFNFEITYPKLLVLGELEDYIGRDCTGTFVLTKNEQGPPNQSYISFPNYETALKQTISADLKIMCLIQDLLMNLYTISYEPLAFTLIQNISLVGNPNQRLMSFSEGN